MNEQRMRLWAGSIMVAQGVLHGVASAAAREHSPQRVGAGLR